MSRHRNTGLFKAASYNHGHQIVRSDNRIEIGQLQATNPRELVNGFQAAGGREIAYRHQTRVELESVFCECLRITPKSAFRLFVRQRASYEGDPSCAVFLDQVNYDLPHAFFIAGRDARDSFQMRPHTADRKRMEAALTVLSHLSLVDAVHQCATEYDQTVHITGLD